MIANEEAIETNSQILQILLEQQSQINELRAEVTLLRKENIVLKQRVFELEIENKSLRDQLKQNSQNSHLPPSRDVHKERKQIKPAFEREGKKQNGGQSGHEGHTLAMRSKVDERIQLIPNRCTCGMRLNGVKTYVVDKRQELDIPKINIQVKEYELHACQCPRCHQEVKSIYPRNIKAPVQYGPMIKATVTALNVDCRVPIRKTKEFLQDLAGISINESTIVNITQQAYKLLEPAEEEIKQKLNESKVNHIDETGVNVNQITQWAHVMSNASATYITIHFKRGKEAFDELLKNYGGILIHDFFESYFSLNKSKHRMCNAHIIRELKFQIEDIKPWAEKLKSFLLELKDPPIQKNKTKKEAIYRKYDRILNQGFNEEPSPIRNGKRGRLKNTKGCNLLNRLWKYNEEVLAFAFDSDIPFTNNQAERDIRPFKVKQKVAGCFRSTRGAKVYARIISFISTLRKNSINVFESLYHLYKFQEFSFV